MQQQITPSLWFNGNANEAITYYLSVFKDSKLVNTSYYPDEPVDDLNDIQGDWSGKELVLEFELLGTRFIAINAGADYKFTEAISFTVSCKDQAEIDYYWERLSSDPKAEVCGWCKDRFGLSWQIVPVNLGELLARPDGFKHMMQMKKLVLDEF